MCGIVAYIGARPAAPLLVEGLRRLEYRGYDSAGLSLFSDGAIHTRKKVGRIDALAALLREKPITGVVGISHTRWATHGAPSDANSHPHLDASGKIALVHNGVIENYQSLKDDLLREGHVFASATDTEVLAHLIGKAYAANGRPDERGLLDAVREALRRVVGTYGIAVLCEDCPGAIVGARRGSPLVVGVGKGENFLSSDVNAIVAHTRDAVYLSDNDMVMLKTDDFQVERLDEREAKVQISRIEHDARASEKGEFPHYMLKEIFEQPQTMLNAMRGRFNRDEASAALGGLNMTNAELRAMDRIIMTACGTSWHAALVGDYLIEEVSRVPCEVEYASEFRYRNPPIDKNTLILAITQSGETADTLAAMREAKRKGHKALGICNVVGSTIARESDGGVYVRAGPEIGVASTKAFTSQVTVLALIALHLGRLHHLSAIQGARFIEELEAIPEKIAQILKQSDAIRTIAARYKDARDFLYLGRQANYPVALEGALKLKEISYIHAEGYPAAEMKHGPIALVDEQTPSVFICPRDAIHEKTLSNMEEVRARRGRLIAIATEADEEIRRHADDVICVPATIDPLYPLLTNIPLQLLAYHIAVLLGRDVDKPRNLAKSVTVE
ncbi:MAG: glutamine--fructose-6-phosphate transaminase (isomerizing) [Verrucomicrobia bacterium]|nr:glutamine--fructose-6-phosphate transaminase (isomerizing) [Verrucomicrobiota bacterium]